MIPKNRLSLKSPITMKYAPLLTLTQTKHTPDIGLLAESPVRGRIPDAMADIQIINLASQRGDIIFLEVKPMKSA